MRYLERHQTDENIHRFYVTDVSQDLFGWWVLNRRWGRVGAQGGQSGQCGQSKPDVFDTQAAAIAAQEVLCLTKVRRGYR